MPTATLMTGNASASGGIKIASRGCAEHGLCVHPWRPLPGIEEHRVHHFKELSSAALMPSQTNMDRHGLRPRDDGRFVVAITDVLLQRAQGSAGAMALKSEPSRDGVKVRGISHRFG